MEETEENLFINVTVHDKEITVSCGTGTQKLQWLGTVAIARYDEDLYQGWKILGAPVHVEKIDTGEGLLLSDTIKKVLKNGDRVKVATSMDPR
mmetsp:Transcript_23230/g.52377  ORF Transcript_23230/g.52377 Transcript_23230/m.52377 type:complete len:93 (-) Transcript_23230:229-507(-)